MINDTIVLCLQKTVPRKLKLSVTRNGGRQKDLLVNITVSYSDDGIQALPGNVLA
jgi:hypothetical protein